MALTDEQRQMKWREGNLRYTEAKISEACAERDARIAELERQLAEARKDAERWATNVAVSEDVLRHPDKRKFPSAVSAYMHEINHGHGIKYAVDAAINAMQKG